MKIKYIINKLLNMRYKEFFSRAHEIAIKQDKSTFFILFDMIKCAIKYGSGYMDYFEFEFYLLNENERKTYITGEKNNRIVRKYNNKNELYKLSDKVVFNRLFKDYLGRDYIDLRSCSFKEFKEFINNKEKIVAKRLSDCGGKGIEVISLDKSKLKNEYNILKIYNAILKKEEFLIEEYINQNQKINELYSGSVNTLRVISFLDDNGQSHILNTILRIGNNGNVDNFSSGGMYTFVNEEGIVYTPAIDEQGRIYYEHPISKCKIVGFKIPYYDKLPDLINKISLIVPGVRYVGWDLVITKKGLCVIEGNEYPGIFQVKPSISNIKTGSLEEFKKYMDI